MLQDAGLAVDVGDRAATRCGVRVRRVIGHQAEVILVSLDLPEVHRPHGPVLDRQLIGGTRPVVRHAEGVAADRRAPSPERLPARIARCPGLRLDGHLASPIHGLGFSRTDYATHAASSRRMAAADQARGRRWRATSVRTRAGAAGEGSRWGPRREGRGSLERGWCGCSGPGRGPMPPSCPGASSGDWLTAQRTSRNSATIGILRKTINQMKVQMSTRFDRIPEPAGGTTPERPARSAAAISLSAEGRRR